MDRVCLKFILDTAYFVKKKQVHIKISYHRLSCKSYMQRIYY